MRSFINNYRTVLYLFLIVSILFCFYIITSQYPILSDDFTYKFFFGQKEPIKNIFNVLESQVDHWFLWNGRFVAHCFVQTFLIFDRVLFCIANTACYALCCGCIAKLISSENFLRNWLLVLLSLWILLPTPGATCFWLTGSFNYLWAICATSVFLFLLFSNNQRLEILAIPVGLFAGNWHEALALSTIVTLTLYSLFDKKKSLWFYVAIGSYLIGLMLNVIAPGNYVRLAGIYDPNAHNKEIWAPLLKCLRNFMKVGYRLTFNWSDPVIQMYFCTWCVLAVVCFKSLKNKTKKLLLPACLLLGGMCSISLNVVSGVSGARSLFGFCFMTYLSTILILAKTPIKKQSSILLIVCVLINFISIPLAYSKINILRTTIDNMQESCLNGKYISKAHRDLDEVKGSRYVGTPPSACTLSNWSIRDFFNVEDMSVLPYNDFEFITNNSLRLNDIPYHEVFVHGDNLCITKLKTRPKNISEKITFNSDYIMKLSKIQKVLHWIETQKYPHKQCFTIRIDDNYYTYWHQYPNTEVKLDIHYPSGEHVVIQNPKS